MLFVGLVDGKVGEILSMILKTSGHMENRLLLIKNLISNHLTLVEKHIPSRSTLLPY
jgi:hypothetical protein